MRRLRNAFALALLACAVTVVIAVAATPALAGSMFTSSGGETIGVGTGVVATSPSGIPESQFFLLGPFHIYCATAKASSGPTTPLESETFFTSVKFKKCYTEADIHGNDIEIKTKFLTPFDSEYNADEISTEIGSEGEETEGVVTLKGGTVELKIGLVKCFVFIEPQKVPVKFKNPPVIEAEFENIGKKMEIRNMLKGIHFEFEGEHQCENIKKEGEELKQGKYTGNMIERTKGAGGFIQILP
jgi:hypothetical protein